jgi:hypothetical protein
LIKMQQVPMGLPLEHDGEDARAKGDDAVMLE